MGPELLGGGLPHLDQQAGRGDVQVPGNQVGGLVLSLGQAGQRLAPGEEDK